MNFIGIDIGGTAVKFGLVTPSGTILHSSQFSVSFDGYKTPILETVLKSCDLFLKEFSIEINSIGGFGISATGQIDTTAGIVAGTGGNIINWEGTHLKKSFKKKYQLPVEVINDANCVALAEKWIGAAKPFHNAIVLTIGTGVGGGIIVNDELLLGHSGFGGEIGHFSINNHGTLCTCGNYGCFEQYASMTALIHSVKSVILAESPTLLETTEIDGKFIFDSLASGNESISYIVNTWISDISSGLVSLTHIFNPEIIVIGGAVSAQKELFISKLRKKVLSHTMKNFGKNLLIEPALLGNNSGLIGAVYYLINHIN